MAGKKQLIAAVLTGALVTGIAMPATQAFSLGDVLKVGGIGFLVDRFAGPLNSFINTLTFKSKAGNEFATKVVPVLTFGSGGYVGAVQVTGSQELVDRTQAVLQLESDFNGGQFRVKALVPVDSKNPVNFTRVQGVGVSATIDVRI